MLAYDFRTFIVSLRTCVIHCSSVTALSILGNLSDTPLFLLMVKAYLDKPNRSNPLPRGYGLKTMALRVIDKTIGEILSICFKIYWVTGLFKRSENSICLGKRKLSDLKNKKAF